MSKALKDLSYIKEQLPFYDGSGFQLQIDESDFIAIEKELKALEIIREMRDCKDDIAIAEIITDVEESEDFEKFSSRYRNFFSKDEYEILKEVFE